jgi:hypothetical protein
MVDQEIFEHRAAEGPADERCHHRLSQYRAPLSPNQMCEKLWTLPSRATQLRVRQRFGSFLRRRNPATQVDFGRQWLRLGHLSQWGSTKNPGIAGSVETERGKRLWYCGLFFVSGDCGSQTKKPRDDCPGALFSRKLC